MACQTKSFPVPIGDAAALAYARSMHDLPTHHDHLADVDLHAALADARIQAIYQPIVRLSDRRPAGLEVLARLDHPSRGTLNPDCFVPPMENAGLSWPLTKAVMRRAFADWSGDHLRQLDLTLALNLPLDVLLFDDALTKLDEERRIAGIAAEQLVIELTESRPITHLDELAAATERLRRIGYGLAIDDVGPAIRDHSALLDLPFTMLKLDKQLVQDALTSTANAEFLANAVAAARHAGFLTVAEGVEDAATWNAMQAAGVDQAQGFLVGRPMPARDIPTWHASWTTSFG